MGIRMSSRILEIAGHAVRSVRRGAGTQAAVGGFELVVVTEAEEIGESGIARDSKFLDGFKQCGGVVDQMSDMYYIGLNISQNLRQNRSHVGLIVRVLDPSVWQSVLVDTRNRYSLKLILCNQVVG